jgi:hypothetical protein
VLDDLLRLSDTMIVNPGGLRRVIEDDGLGIAAQSDGRGSRQGQALHSTLLAMVGVSLDLQSVPETYTRVLLSLPAAPVDES